MYNYLLIVFASVKEFLEKKKKKKPFTVNEIKWTL